VCCWVYTDERAHFNYKKINIQKTSTPQTETQSLIYNVIAVAHRLVLAIAFCQLSSHRAKTVSNTFKRYDGGVSRSAISAAHNTKSIDRKVFIGAFAEKKK